MGSITREEGAVLRIQAEPFLRGLFDDGAYRGWFVEFGGKPVCGGGVWMRYLEPRPGCLHGGRWAHVVNVYTEPEHRRRGLARALMAEVLGWYSANADDITLAASEDGRPLYEDLSFAATNYMRFKRR